MKAKKLLTLALCAVLALTLFGGCAQTDSTPTGGTANTPPASNTPGNSNTPETPNTPDEPDNTVTMPQGFDKATVNWIVPAAAGSAIDLVTRGITDALGSNLGANVVVENLAGASQTIGAAEFSIRNADGHNLLTMANACYFTQPLINELTYDIADWRPICNMAPPSSCCVAVKAGSALADPDAWIAALKAGNFTYGYANTASIGHLAALQALDSFQAGEGTAIVYNGSPELTAAVLSGEIDFAVMEDNVLLSYVNSGEMACVMACTNEAHADFPGAGYIGNYIDGFVPINGVKCIAVLKDTPEEEVAWLKAQLNAAIASDAYQDYLVSNGYAKMDIMEEEELSAWLSGMLQVSKDVMTKAGLI